MKGLRIADDHESCFHAWKRSHMCIANLLGGGYNDVQELRFKTENLSNIGNNYLQVGLFADGEERLFLAAKRAEMGSAISQGGGFVDPEESRILVAKGSELVIADMKGLPFADAQESCFHAWKRS